MRLKSLQVVHDDADKGFRGDVQYAKYSKSAYNNANKRLGFKPKNFKGKNPNVISSRLCVASVCFYYSILYQTLLSYLMLILIILYYTTPHFLITNDFQQALHYSSMETA